jgi:hypothetical protein
VFLVRREKVDGRNFSGDGSQDLQRRLDHWVLAISEAILRFPYSSTRSNTMTLWSLSALMIFLFGGLSPARTMLIAEGTMPFFFAHFVWPPARFTSERSNRTTSFWSSARMSVLGSGSV